MISKSGTYFGQPIIIACDAKCHKAWGSIRPRVYLDDPTGKVYGDGFTDSPYPDDDETIDVDNWAQLADDELPDAPDDNGWTEGDEAKPRAPEERLNKWCARQCERSCIVDDKFPVKDFELPDFSQRFYNIAPHTRNEEKRYEAE